MTNEEAKDLYTRAVGLADANQVDLALQLLDQIDAERPNSRHVTYHRARCLIGLGRMAEARECMQRLDGKAEKDRLDELRALIAAKQAEAQVQASANAAPPVEENGANVFVIETVFPASTDQAIVTGHVKSGMFRVGDALTIVSPEGLPVLAPIVRIGSAETPINFVRSGQKAPLLLRVEPHHVVPGSTATSETQEDSYAKTMVASVDTPTSSPKELTGDLVEAEKLVRRGRYADARAVLAVALSRDAGRWPAHWLLARVYLESEAPLQDVRKSLECVREAYELGGAEDSGVIATLAQALAANGEAPQGLRFLERLYEGKLSFEARSALAHRIQEFRAQHHLGHVWEFADQYGDVIFEAVSPKDIEKALRSGTIVLGAKCRRDRIGEWRPAEDVLAAELPELAALFKAAPAKGKPGLWIVLAVLAIAVAAALALMFLR